MVEMKTRELIGKPLDWAVAQYADKHVHIVDIHWGNYCPSTNWAVGGPIIEREQLWLQSEIGKEGCANFWYCVSMQHTDAYGPTPLIAAMRCLVSAKLGDTISIPKELL